MFIGNGYELCFEQGTERWYAFSSRRIDEGELPVFVRKDAVLSFGDPPHNLAGFSV
jgi:hypothetical protein